MTLLDLTKELFTYLVRFREQAAGERPPNLEKVEADLEAIFARMRDQAEANPLLSKGFEEVRYSLAALVDEVVLTSVWPHQAQWGQRGWERRLFGSQDGSRRFFDFLERLDSLPKDVLAVHYLCLALGFCGCYQPGDPELQKVKARVLTRLPGLENGAGPLPPPAISLTPLPAREPPPAAKSPPGSPARIRTAKAPPRPRDLRYLLVGGLAVLAFFFTLGLGVVVFFNHEGDQEPPGENALEELLKPLLPVKPQAAAPPSPAPAPAPATISQAKVEEKLTATASANLQASETTTSQTTATTQATTSSTTTLIPAPAPTTASAPAPAAASPDPAAAPLADKPALLAASPAASTTYLLHAGLFVGPIQSGRLAERLSQAGFAAWVREEPRQDGSVRYRVYVGPFADPQRAEAAREAIVAQFKFSPFLVEHTTP